MSTETEGDAAGAATDIAQSNSLADLAARSRAEHEATDAALKGSVEHAMAAGDLLIGAKARHQRWPRRTAGGDAVVGMKIAARLSGGR
jgi:hypothetical protein